MTPLTMTAAQERTDRVVAYADEDYSTPQYETDALRRAHREIDALRAAMGRVGEEHDEWKAEALRLDTECDAAKEEARQAKASAGRARYDLTLARAENAEVEVERLRGVLGPMRLRRAVAAADELRKEWGVYGCQCAAPPCTHSKAWDRYDAARSTP